MNWPWPHFTKFEMACKCCGEVNMDPGFMDKLESLRSAVGFGLAVNSGYRCSKHNLETSDTGTSGPHTTGKAVDLDVNRAQAFLVLKAALALGFTGIGVSQKGPSRFLHLDTLEDGRPTIWSY